MQKYYKRIVRLTSVLLFIILSHQNSFAIPGWQWAKTAGGTSEERSRNTAFDSNGNVYSIGSYTGADIIFGSTNLQNAGSDDVYLVKYDPSGNVLWAHSYGTSSGEIGYSVTCDHNGNIYITGLFNGPSITFGSFTINGSGNIDIFLVKLDQIGNVLWANSYGGTGDDFGNNLYIDINENVFLVGNFTSPSINFGNTTLFAIGTSKAFVAKFDQNGLPLWAGGARGPSYDVGKCVTTDSNGNIYMAGEYYEFQVWFNTDSLMNSGEDDIFIVKYDPNGNELWVKSFGGFDPDKVTGLVAEDNGDVYISGQFFSPFIQFDSTTLNNAHFTSWDMYIAKLDVNANVTWAKSAIGNTDEDVIVDMKKGLNGNLFVAGWYKSSITLGNTTLTNNALADVFVAELDSAGSFQWALSAGGSDQDYTYSISVDQNGDAIIGGFFNSNSMSFGGISLTDVNAGWDMFVAKLSNQTAVKETTNDLFNLYPNPANDNFKIIFPDKNNYTIELRNSIGEIVLQGQFNNSNQLFSCADFSKGIYLLRIETKGEIVTRKLIVR